MNPWGSAWERLLLALRAPVLARQKVALLQSAEMEAANVKSRVWLHAQDLRVIGKILQQATEALSGLPSADQAVVELTRARIQEVVMLRREELHRKARGLGPTLPEGSEEQDGKSQ